MGFSKFCRTVRCLASNLVILSDSFGILKFCRELPERLKGGGPTSSACGLSFAAFGLGLPLLTPPWFSMVVRLGGSGWNSGSELELELGSLVRLPLLFLPLST